MRYQQTQNIYLFTLKYIDRFSSKTDLYDVDEVGVKIEMLNGLVYYVNNGEINQFDEIRFYDMDNIHIPCYSKYLSFHIRINDETIAATQKLSLYDVSTSLDSTLVIELFDSSQEWNGWILITSNDNQCFGL